ncbi:FAD-dependent oxidoreductase [Gordonia terrae]|uniref:FAD-dependent oxidoreductase n=1 Tax=Gordonia terrae TaxID=2055 RepID=UPI00200B820C|nr:FAD-dependent oxidoreductase [Gordonia terrae]UPW08077.1 FAD-dependent oxidoreductase [Gordonia terrae]
MSAEQLYIDPEACIGCAACMWECPVGAIHDEFDLPAHLEDYKEINAEYFVDNPLEVRDPMRTARRQLPEQRPQLRVAVVGSGPSGCYAVDQLSSITGVEVTLIDMLPTPYGLARSGVAPDHLATKGIAKMFAKIIRRPNVRCLFNIHVGVDITMAELRETHHAVILATGADTDRKLGIDGEDLAGSHSAREFVSWYNGHPDHAGLEPDLSAERVVIIGNGNVALDAARLLVAEPDALRASDMADHAVAALSTSAVREVVVVARRGVADAAYSASEFAALCQLDGVDVVAHPDEIGEDLAADAVAQSFTGRRKLDLARTLPPPETRASTRRIVFRYGLTPESIGGENRVESVTFRRTGADDSVSETLATGLVLRAIGYRSSPMPEVPFDDIAGTIAHDGGRIVADAGDGMYCVGWAKRGPSGVIGTNQVCAAETTEKLLADFRDGKLPEPAHATSHVDDLLAERGTMVVRHDQWLSIDAAELKSGQEAQRPRVKLVSVDDLLGTLNARL